MQYLKTYLNKIIERGNIGLAESISSTSEDVGNNYLKNFIKNGIMNLYVLLI